MTDRERWYRLAMLAYPQSYRAHREEELIATLLDASDRSRPRLRELLALIVGGLGYRAQRLPGAADGVRLTGSVAALLVVTAAVSTVVASARLGYAAASSFGVAVWMVLAVAVVVRRAAGGRVGRASVVAALSAATVAVVGGAGLMGAHRSLLAPIFVLTLVSIGCPASGRRTAAVTGAVAATGGLVAGAWLAVRIDEHVSRWGLDVDVVWRGNPWMLAGLDGSSGYTAVAALLVTGIVVGLVLPRVAITVALLAVPLCLTAAALTNSAWGGAPRSLPIPLIVAAVTVGLAIAVAMCLAAQLARRRHLTNTLTA